MASIVLKWIHDKHKLPLSRSHWSLYCVIHRLCYRELGRFPNLVNCKDYNDKIQWLKLFDQDRVIIKCSDKLGLREYVTQRVGGELLPQLYQVCDRFDQIDFSTLPASFVIKTNHDSGSVMLVRDASMVDQNAAAEFFDKAIGKPYGWHNGEWAYSYIHPKVFVEEFIGPELGTPPPDYKFHCVDGRVRWLQYIFDRGFGTKECIVDANGQITQIHFDQNMVHVDRFDKPAQWDDLKGVAEKLAAGHRYVRVDLFLYGNRIYVGEMTFYPLMGCYKTQGQRTLGGMMDFDRQHPKATILPALERECSRSQIYSNVS